MNQLLYWGSLLGLMLVGMIAVSLGLPVKEELSGIFFLGLFWLHMGAGHYLGYTGMLKRKFRTLPWRRAYQRRLCLGYSLIGLAFLIACFTPEGTGVYVIIITALPCLFYINASYFKLEKQHLNDLATQDTNGEE